MLQIAAANRGDFAQWMQMPPIEFAECRFYFMTREILSSYLHPLMNSYILQKRDGFSIHIVKKAHTQQPPNASHCIAFSVFSSQFLMEIYLFIK